jgi:hypothetical protein
MLRRLVLAALLLVPATAAADTKADAEAVLASWVKAFNAGDAKGYAALYDKAFVGTRTDAKGKTKTLKLAAWKKDQRALIQAKGEVEATDVTVTVAADDTATIDLVHHWAYKTKAGHGKRTLTLRRNAAGALAIVGETVAAAEPGWEDKKNRRSTRAVGRKVDVMVTTGKSEQVGDCKKAPMILRLTAEQGLDDIEMGESFVLGDQYPYDVGTTTMFYAGKDCGGTGHYYEVRRRGDAVYVLTKSAKDDPWTTSFFVQFWEGAKIRAIDQMTKDAEDERRRRRNELD